MRVHWKSWLVFALLLGTTAYCVAEEIALTTYYPSPRGVYQELRATGSVGIGTMSPANKLEVAGTLRSTTETIPTGGTGTEMFYNTAANRGMVVAYDRTASAYRRLDLNDVITIAGGGATGNVGIGTPTPDKALHVKASGLGPDGGSRAGITVENSSGNKFFLNTWDGVNRFSIGRTGVADDLVIQNGSIGIGIVPGTIGGGGPRRLEVRGASTAAADSALRIWNSADDELLAVTNDGGIFMAAGNRATQAAKHVNIGWGAGFAGQKLNVNDPDSDWQITAFKSSPSLAYLTMGANDSAARIQGWGLLSGGPRTLVLQPNGGNTGIGGNRMEMYTYDGANNFWFTTGGVEPGSVFLGFNGVSLGDANSVSIAPRGNHGVFVNSSGNVGIGTAAPNPHRLFVNGNMKLTGDFDFGDVAEPIDCPDCEAGEVVVIDPAHDRQLTRATRAYDGTVAGVISEKPTLHIGGSRSETAKPLALAGQVKCKVTTENGPIQRGELLVTSSTPGHAMRADPDEVTPGTLIGKALEPLAEGEGTILVLITGG